MDNTKKCPFCGEEVLDVAKKCKHCGEWLEKTANENFMKSEIVTIDNSAKLENLYKVARRAAEDGNTEQAFKKYEQLQMEDPDNWEPNFYVAYYSGLNSLKNDKPGSSVRISGGQVSLDYNYRSGIAPCITTIHNCIDNVFSLIEDIQDYDEQKEAVDTIYEDIKNISSVLMDIIESEHKRMAGEIEHYQREADVGFFAGSKMYSKNSDVRNGYDRKLLNMLESLDKRRDHLEDVVGKRRFDEFWAANQPLKAELESEKQSLNEQIVQLNKDIEAVPGYTEMVDSQMQLNEEKGSAQSLIIKPKTGWLVFGIIVGIIGAFFTFGISLILSIICGVVRYNKMKPYKAQQADVESDFKQKTQSLNEKYSRVVSDVEAIKKNIVSCENRINEIDTELTKPR